MGIDERVEKIIEGFARFNDWEERYKHLIDLGKELRPMTDEQKVEENKIKGCQSQVWLYAQLSNDKIILSADSDASIVKGIVALLIQVYSESTPDEILSTKPDFIGKIGLIEHLSMSRANGLNSMVKQIMFYAMAFKAKLAMNK